MQTADPARPRIARIASDTTQPSPEVSTIEFRVVTFDARDDKGRTFGLQFMLRRQNGGQYVVGGQVTRDGVRFGRILRDRTFDTVEARDAHMRRHIHAVAKRAGNGQVGS